MPSDSRPPASRWLVSPDWLAGHLDAPDVIVVDGSFYLAAMNRDARGEYLAGHIPGAVFFDIDAVKDHSSALPHMLPSARQFAADVGQLGIGDGQTIVVYDGLGLYGAARVWWMFRTFGAQQVLVLDGGLPAWKADNRPLEAGAVSRQPRTFTARLDRSMVAGVDDVQKALNGGGVQVVDARAAERFRGEAPEPRPGLRSGHMPGALNLPFQSVLDGGRLAAPEHVAAAFRAAGVDLDKPVITSCGSGVTAAILTFALDSLGKPAGRVYDGSWSEWGAGTDLPVATGPK
jgi:thiosulfate/3-mercaptopyruvate sulfurtransferase